MDNDNKVSYEATNDLIVGVMERQIKRYHHLVLVLLAIIALMIGGALIYESQFDKVAITQEGATDGGGDVNVSGVGKGDINNYAESKANY